MKKLYFVRHGESEMNVQRVFAGQIDTPLTDLGREQAQNAALEAQNLQIDLIVSSPLSRAHETAQIIARKIDYPVGSIVVNDLFKERSLGTLEGKSWDEFEETADGNNGVEPDQALNARAAEGLDFLMQQSADNILLVGHGSFYVALRKVIYPGDDYPEPDNAKIMELI